MKMYVLVVAVIAMVACSSCNRKVYQSNGETIYKTGRNIAGEKMLDKHASRITIVSSCKTCHGPDGTRMNAVSIKFSFLSNPKYFTVPYNDTLFYRFLDKDLKTDGIKANIGVIWKMNDKDKQDLLAYLKTL